MSPTGRERGKGNPPLQLTVARRFEAAGFRAWPAETVHYDGTWAIRVTRYHAAKRLNSINPLDPGDSAGIDERIARARTYLDRVGAPVTFRLSPLASPEIGLHLERLSWRRFGESWVMTMSLDEQPMIEAAIDRIPLRTIPRFVAAIAKMKGNAPGSAADLSRVIASIQAETGLFVFEDEGKPVATTICVQDGNVAGLFEVATMKSERGKGHARQLILSALKWARSRGAATAWLQVEADNRPALGLYDKLGFRTLYAYHYWQPAEI